MSKTNLAWFYVVLGGLVECFWISGLKYSTKPWHYAITGLGICISFVCMMKACKMIEVSIAYSVFVGIGTAGVVMAEILIFKESFSLLKLFFIALLLFSVVGLKLSSKEN